MSNSWNITIIGAGKIGRMIAALLNNSGDYRVTIADQNERALKAAARGGVKALKLDVSDEEALVKALNGEQAVLSAAPFFLTPVIARAAKRAKAHYFDLTEDVASTKLVKGLAEGAQTAFAPQCGLAPGFVSIAGHDLAQKFERLESLTLRVGALPRYPTNALKYNLTWSTEGLINEYCNPCEAIVGGAPVFVEPLDGYETFALDGANYEAFNTSGGLGSLSETLAGKVENLRYLTIRYPGHRDILRLLLQDLGLKKRQDLMCEIFETALPRTKQDIVLVFLTAKGVLENATDDSLTEASAIYQVHAREIAGESWSAIQISTSAGVCTAIDLMRAGEISATGFIRQEDIPLASFLKNRFGRLFLNEASNMGVAPRLHAA